MTKRKTKRAQKGIEPILDKLKNRVGYTTPERIYFNHNPAAFIERILDSEPEKVAETILIANGIQPEYIEHMKANPDKPLSFRWEDGVEVTLQDTLTFAEALQYAREMREAIERAFQERIKRAIPTQYPLSRSIIDGLTGTAPKGRIRCIDENKLNQAAHLKLEHIFLTLLNETSAERNPKSAEYFTGNLGAEVVPIGAGIGAERGGAEVELKEVFKRWKGGQKLGATDKRFIAKTIKEYRELVFTWQYQGEVEGGKVLTVEHQAPRVEVILYSLKEKKEEELEHGGELITEAGAKIVLRFHPAFLAFKLRDAFAYTPANLSEILEYAAGGGRKVTAAHWRLFHYLNSIRSSKKDRTEVGQRELMQKIGLDGYLHGRNESKGEEALRGVIADIQKTGLLSGHSERRGAAGERVFCFEINREPVYIQHTEKRIKRGDRVRKKGG